jgi:prolyl 4-hydroxylase
MDIVDIGKKLQDQSLNNKMVMVIDNFLSKDECIKLIGWSEIKGYSDIQTNKYNNKFTDPDFRNDKSCTMKLSDLNKESNFIKDFEQKIKTYAPNLSGINNLIRFSKYIDGGKCIAHKDATYLTSNSKSTHTILVYLNSLPKNNGCTRFTTTNNTNYFDIQPIVGRAIIFDQSLLHSSTPINNNTKYTIRTDLLKKIKPISSIKTAPSTKPIKYNKPIRSRAKD